MVQFVDLKQQYYLVLINLALIIKLPKAYNYLYLTNRNYILVCTRCLRTCTRLANTSTSILSMCTESFRACTGSARGSTTTSSGARNHSVHALSMFVAAPRVPVVHRIVWCMHGQCPRTHWQCQCIAA